MWVSHSEPCKNRIQRDFSFRRCITMTNTSWIIALLTTLNKNVLLMCVTCFVVSAINTIHSVWANVCSMSFFEKQTDSEQEVFSMIAKRSFLSSVLHTKKIQTFYPELILTPIASSFPTIAVYRSHCRVPPSGTVENDWTFVLMETFAKFPCKKSSSGFQ